MGGHEVGSSPGVGHADAEGRETGVRWICGSRPSKRGRGHGAYRKRCVESWMEGVEGRAVAWGKGFAWSPRGCGVREP